MTCCKVVAEIGCTHLGDIERAKELAKLAKLSGVKYFKTQKRDPELCLPASMQNAAHPNPQFAYGNTYLEHRQNLELDADAHAELMVYCEEELDIYYGVSVWDMISAQEMIDLNPPFIKVGSPCNQNWGMLDLIFEKYKGTGKEDIHISLGMVTLEERSEIIRYAGDKGVDQSRIVWYHCTSEYPCPFDRLYLNEIKTLKSLVPPGVSVGFSNHGRGIATDIAAYLLGATWIERHFVDDRTLRHTDAAASLEPDGMRRLIRDLEVVHKALRNKEKMSEDELSQRRKLKGN